MTPITQLTIHSHVRVYLDQVATDIQTTRSAASPVRKIRRAIARGLVRTGAWLLPDKPGMVGDTVIVLLRPLCDTPEQEAA